MNKNKLIFIIFISLVVGGVSYFISKDFFNKTNHELLTENSSLEETKDELPYEIEVIQVEKLEGVENNKVESSMPNLDRRINFAKADAKSKLKIEEISEMLKNDSNNIYLWLDLGSWRKATGDYEGAIEAWEYVIVLAPKNSIALNNLGDLYAYYLNDLVKAEEFFLKAIENSPADLFSYSKTFDFYTEVLKDEAKAKAILEKGIAANPDTSQDLQNLLNLYYK